MPQLTPTSEAISELIRSREPFITQSADRGGRYELQHWTVQEVDALLNQLAPRLKKAGNAEPCGPEFNHNSSLFKWMQIPVWSMFAIGCAFLAPLQIYGAIYLTLHGKFQAIWRELPTPTVLAFDWASNMFSFVKAPRAIMRESIQQQAALCVNRAGKFSLKADGYAVLSHVWAETCGWQTPTDWGPVEPEVRKKGVYYEHFLKFFDRCDAEWLWVDILAMPEVFDDMTLAEKSETEDVRTGVINSLRNIYLGAEKVVYLDSLLLRLQSGSMIDAAMIFCMGLGMRRLWIFTEIKLAKRVMLKTNDSAFDLDQIVEFLYKDVGNQDHPYFPLFTRLLYLRPIPSGQRKMIRSPLRPDSEDSNLLVDIYHGTENRNCNVEIDKARALFPLLDLKWQTGWTLQQGLQQIANSFPGETDILLKYCDYRNIDFTLLASRGNLPSLSYP